EMGCSTSVSLAIKLIPVLVKLFLRMEPTRSLLVHIQTWRESGVSVDQTIIPESEGTIKGHLKEVGLMFHLNKRLSSLISENLEKALIHAFSPFGLTDGTQSFGSSTQAVQQYLMM
nr:chalcone synthase [Tanacetum cinerariifolium]